ncbi:transporter substrate-binding domain-containing protein [Zwartia sp.]|uniref:transporter substrate-binding domain-containing protein n=1 Tax=Zwartia sp. TaxID=2978004 RepID=UPI002725F09B|nr:transporter substrate-binding domain-containing protein [Zwartia sp.]MDO9024298.1 transporter substrate-binding domain-containing protein [Zwartia sp.]
MNIAHLKLAAVLMTLLTGVSISSNAQTLKKIEDTNKITVSFRESSIPFSYLPAPGNKAVGFAVDLTEEIINDVKKQLNKPNLEIAYIPVNGQNRIPLLVNGTYDLECGSTTNTAARGKEVSFAISHFYAGTRVLAKKASNIKSYSDLNKKIVASTAGSTNEKVIRQHALENNIDVELLLGKDYADAFNAVEIDRAVAFAMDDILLFGLIANSKQPEAFEVVGKPLQVEPYGCMVRKDDPAFKKLVDTTIARLMATGEFTKLYAKWFESAIPPKGIILNMPMSAELKNNLKALSDQPM